MSACGTNLVNNVLVSTRSLELRQEWKGLSFTELLFLLAREHVQYRGQDLPWLTDGHTGKKILLAEMEKSARSVARVLQQKGLRPGEVLTMVDRSRVETPVLAMAVWLCGAVFNTMDPNPPRSTLEGNLSALRPKILLTCSDYLDKLQPFCAENSVEVWLYDQPGSIADHVPAREELTDECEDPFPTSEDPTDLALVLWSSGSTGSPKG